jgi:DNA replication protein DnaC
MQTLLKDLRSFKLSGMASNLEIRLSYAKTNKLAYQELLELLCEDEKDNRRSNSYRKRLHQAKLPSRKMLEDFDFSFQNSIDQRQINDAATCRFIADKSNILLIGDSGTGKTHLGIALGLKALAKEYTVYFTTVSDMLYEMHVSKADNSYNRLLKRLISYDLLILDELGFKQLPSYSADDFFSVISKRYESKSTIITTNKVIDEWNDIFAEEVLTKAIVDRIMHHSNIFHIKGKSYRMKNLNQEANMA